MTNLRIEVLLHQYAANTISREDYLELIAYFKLSGNDAEINIALDSIWNNIDTGNIEDVINQQEQAYQKIITDKRFTQVEANVRILWRWMPYAAAAVLLVFAGAGYLFLRTPPVATVAQRYKNDVKPGSNKATLTLANGKVINLSNASANDISAQAGINVSKANNGELVYAFNNNNDANQAEQNTVTTPIGGQYQVVLPDGTHVWLNSSSSLKFPVKFSENERKVTLTGEGYFEVAKNAAKPFRVITAGQQVEVHGTHFDVNAYADDKAILTTLLEGAVSITANGKITPLQPGQQAGVNVGNIIVKTVDTEEAVAWKNGLFMYTDQELESIMKQVARWYDVSVTYDDDALRKQIFSGTLSRFKNISQLLEVLEATGSVHFKIEGRRISVMK